MGHTGNLIINFNIKALIYAYTSSRSTVHSRGQSKKMFITSQEPDFVAIFYRNIKRTSKFEKTYRFVI